MKILHTSDWHLGKRLEKFSRIEEQQEVLNEICEISDCEQVNVVVIAGDLFDTFNPPIEAIDLFYKTLKRLTNNGNRAVIAIAGNHDSPDRIESPDPLARECGIIFLGYPNSKTTQFKLETGLKVTKSDNGFLELSLPNTKSPLRIISTPYANETRLKVYLGSEDSEEELRQILQKKWQELADNYCDNKGVNLLTTHLFLVGKGEEQPEEPEDEKPILHVGGAQVVYTENIPKQIQYTALGHLHRKLINNKKAPVIYSGSPLAYSMSESNQDKFVMVIDVEPDKEAIVKQIQLTKGKRLIRQKFDNVEKAIDWLTANPETLVELTMVTDTFLTAEERKQILNAHQGIVAIIPEVKNMAGSADKTNEIDLNKKIDDLFIDYFKNKYNQQEPSVEILDLFKEIKATEQDK
ncbi:MAG: exonuclease subunit SbcD [Candidatus Margulisbacteria bacterium]|nr:exonuclease subunit SbcD [Candidatus Margulisiibacteriota bacterium]